MPYQAPYKESKESTAASALAVEGVLFTVQNSVQILHGKMLPKCSKNGPRNRTKSTKTQKNPPQNPDHHFEHALFSHFHSFFGTPKPQKTYVLLRKSDDFQKILTTVENPYGKGDATEKIMDVLKNETIPIGLKKTFYDL